MSVNPLGMSSTGPPHSCQRAQGATTGLVSDSTPDSSLPDGHDEDVRLALAHSQCASIFVKRAPRMGKDAGVEFENPAIVGCYQLHAERRKETSVK